jgi:hypothetical protein
LNTIKAYQFTNVSFTIFNGTYKATKFNNFIEEDKIKEDDLIVDVSQMDNVGLNISAGIRPVGFFFNSPDRIPIYTKSISLTNNRELVLWCTVGK